MTPRRPRLLLVEDNPGDVELLTEALREVRATIDIHHAPRATEAFAHLARCAEGAVPGPDLVVLDLNLPVISGLEILRALRGAPAWQALPIMVFTSTERLAEHDQVRASGATHLRRKPNDWDGYQVIAKELVAFAADCARERDQRVSPPG